MPPPRGDSSTAWLIRLGETLVDALSVDAVTQGVLDAVRINWDCDVALWLRTSLVIDTGGSPIPDVGPMMLAGVRGDTEAAGTLVLDGSDALSAHVLEGGVHWHRSDSGAVEAHVALSTGGTAQGALRLRFLLGAEARPSSHDLTSLALFTARSLERAVLLQERSGALLALQSALLPTLPASRLVQIAARYQPASGRDRIGGDWYDALVLPTGEEEVVVGDVVGHDLAAAARMGQLRSSLRSLAWSIDDTPAGHIARLDRMIADLGMDTMASLIYGRIETGEQGDYRFRWTNAGHPPPLLLLPRGGLRWLTSRDVDVMLGVHPMTRRLDHETEVPAGATLLMFTDGLVENRREDPDLGMERLAALASGLRDLPPDELADRLLRAQLPDRLTDDVALLCVRFAPPGSR